MAIKQVSVLVENKAGAIHEIISFFKDHDVNIYAINMADTPNFGILRFIVDRPERTIEILGNEGYTVSTCDVLAVGLDDTPGGLTKVSGLLYKNNISLEYIYAFISNSDTKACVIIHTADIEFTEKILADAGIPLFEDNIFNK